MNDCRCSWIYDAKLTIWLAGGGMAVVLIALIAFWGIPALLDWRRRRRMEPPRRANEISLSPEILRSPRRLSSYLAKHDPIAKPSNSAAPPPAPHGDDRG